MQMSLSQKLAQEVRLNLKHLITMSNVLAMPTQAIDMIMSSIALNPGQTEEMIVRGSRGSSFDSDTRAVFSELSKGKSAGYNPDRKNGGFIAVPNIRPLESLLGEGASVTVSPDVTYYGIKDEKPKIIFSSDLVDSPELRFEIDGRFERASNLYKYLSKLRSWRNSKLRESYAKIGGDQREFIGTLEPWKLNALNQEELAHELSVHSATVSRLIRGRVVRIIADGKEELHPVYNLLPSRDDILRLQAVYIINGLLESEPERGTLSDGELSEKARVARRTVAKYRLVAGIPNQRERKEIYDRSPLTRFSVPYF